MDFLSRFSLFYVVVHSVPEKTATLFFGHNFSK